MHAVPVNNLYSSPKPRQNAPNRKVIKNKNKKILEEREIEAHCTAEFHLCCLQANSLHLNIIFILIIMCGTLIPAFMENLS